MSHRVEVSSPRRSSSANRSADNSLDPRDPTVLLARVRGRSSQRQFASADLRRNDVETIVRAAHTALIQSSAMGDIIVEAHASVMHVQGLGSGWYRCVDHQLVAERSPTHLPPFETTLPAAFLHMLTHASSLDQGYSPEDQYMKLHIHAAMAQHAAWMQALELDVSACPFGRPLSDAWLPEARRGYIHLISLAIGTAAGAAASGFV